MRKSLKNEENNLGGTINRSTETCRDFLKGICNRGPNCRFSHSMPRDSTDSALLCRDFMAGKCFRSNCKFLHEMPPHTATYRRREYETEYEPYDSGFRDPYSRERMHARPPMERSMNYDIDPAQPYADNWYRNSAYRSNSYNEFQNPIPAPPFMGQQPQFNNAPIVKNRPVGTEGNEANFAFQGNASPYYPTTGVQASTENTVTSTHFNKPLVFEEANITANPPVNYQESKEYVETLQRQINSLIRENEELKKEVSAFRQFGVPMRNY